jgi:hypothetical protein
VTGHIRKAIESEKCQFALTPEAQRLAALPKETFEAVRNGDKTRTEAKREVRRAEAVKKVAEIPKGKFRVFYADPPWKYGDES